MNDLPAWVRALVAAVAVAIFVGLAWPAPSPASVTLAQLIAPYAEGQPVVRGYRLMPPRRGEEHDIVMVARREAGPEGPAAQVQLHVVDRGRWPGIRETRSFGVAYETPKSPAPEADRDAVTEAVASAIRANDPGLGPVDTIALQAEPPRPAIARSLQRMGGARGGACALALLALLWVLSTLRRGGVWVALGLAALGSALRFAHLGLPFVRDQDVQRIMTSHGSWGDVLLGMGLRDRHPPLYFGVLHMAQWFGQSEAVVRFPAAAAGALLAPAVVLAAWMVRRKLEVTTLAAAAAVALSPELVSRSREVSEIPLFGLLAIAAATAMVADRALPRVRAWTLGVTHAGLLWTYYIAPWMLAGQWLALLRGKPPERGVTRAALLGAALGAPALALAIATLVRDYGAREVASRFPGLAWGHHSPGEMARACLSVAGETFGLPLLVTWAALLLLASIRQRERLALVPVAGVVATGLGLVAFAPIARLQPYYLAAVLPLLPLAVSLAPPLPSRRAETIRHAVAAAAVMAFAAQRLPAASLLYTPPPDAFMPAFAEVIASRPERHTWTVTHYDATLLFYYLGRALGTDVGWHAFGPDGAIHVGSTGRTIVPMVLVHQLEDGTGKRAADELERRARQEGLLVVDRMSFRIAEVDAVLAGCTVLKEAATARLLRCGPAHE